MANKFEIVISAVDQTTATVRKVKASFATLMAPVTDLGKSLSSFSRETGLDRVGKALTGLGRSAVDVARSVASIAPPIAALAGLGSVAGIASLATGWGKAGQSIQRTSQLIGISAGELQAYEGASKLAGLSTDDMTSGLQSLGDTLQGAWFGRAPQALALMSAYGVGMHKLKDGSVDTTRALSDVAGMIQKNFANGGNIVGARQIAQAFGVESLLPMLMKGPEYIQKMVDEAKQLGFVMGPDQIENANQYARNIAVLDLTVDGLKNTVGNALIPVLQPLLMQLASWVTQNRDLIATKVADFVRDFSATLKGFDWSGTLKGISNFVSGANDAAEAVGGWKNVLIGLAGVKLFTIIAQVTSLGTALAAVSASLAALSGYKIGEWLRPKVDEAVRKTSDGQYWSWHDVVTGTNRRDYAATGGYTQDELDSVKDGGGAKLTAPRLKGSVATPDDMSIVEMPGNGMSIEEIPAGVTGADSTSLFAALERKENLPPGTLDKYWSAESSRGRSLTGPVTRSGEQARGHFQFMKATAEQYGVRNPDDLADSATGAARFLHHLYGKYGNDDRRVAAAYNWGEGNVDRQGLASAPAQTQAYMDKIAPSIYGNGERTTEASDSNGAVMAGGGAQAGKVQVDINFKNTPRGTVTQARSSGNVNLNVGSNRQAASVG